MNRGEGVPCVYAIHNRLDGRLYIGSTVNPHARWLAHVAELRRGRHLCVALQRAWTVDGPAAFEHVVVQRVDSETEARMQETRWLRIYGATGRLYNTLTHSGTRLPEDAQPRRRALPRAAGRPGRGYPKGRPRTKHAPSPE